LPQVGWFAVLSDAAGFIDEAYVIAVTPAAGLLGPMLTLDHAVMFVGAANLLATQNPPPDHKELKVLVTYPPPNVAPYAVLQLPLLSPQDPAPQIGQWASLWSTASPPVYIDKALIIAVAPATPQLGPMITLDHAVSFVGSALLKSGPRKPSSPRPCHGQGQGGQSECKDEEKIVIEVERCRSPSPRRGSKKHPRGCQCDACCRVEVSVCEDLDHLKCKKLEARKACLHEACIDHLTVNHLSAPSFSQCNLVRGQVQAASYVYTLGAAVAWATVSDDPSSMYSVSGSGYVIPAVGYYDASAYLNLSSLMGAVPVVGIPVANVALCVNGTPTVQTYIPFLSFSSKQVSSLSSSLLLAVGDLVTITFNVIYLDAVAGELSYVGTMQLSPPSFFSLIYLSSLCTSKGKGCECK
jgi:hypothetical protein